MPRADDLPVFSRSIHRRVTGAGDTGAALQGVRIAFPEPTMLNEILSAIAAGLSPLQLTMRRKPMSARDLEVADAEQASLRSSLPIHAQQPEPPIRKAR